MDRSNRSRSPKYAAIAEPARVDVLAAHDLDAGARPLLLLLLLVAGFAGSVPAGRDCASTGPALPTMRGRRSSAQARMVRAYTGGPATSRDISVTME
jgi:hypothetical protein